MTSSQPNQPDPIDDLAKELANKWFAERRHTPNGRWAECKAEADRQLEKLMLRERLDALRGAYEMMMTCDGFADDAYQPLFRYLEAGMATLEAQLVEVGGEQ